MFRYALALILLADVATSRSQKVDDHDYKLGVNVELVLSFAKKDLDVSAKVHRYTAIAPCFRLTLTSRSRFENWFPGRVRTASVISKDASALLDGA